MAVDYWDLNEVLDKYPIRNDGEWKFTGNLIKSTIKFNDINFDPWFRDFTESKKTFISDEAGILIYGYTTIQNKRVRLWSC